MSKRTVAKKKIVLKDFSQLKTDDLDPNTTAFVVEACRDVVLATAKKHIKLVERLQDSHPDQARHHADVATALALTGMSLGEVFAALERGGFKIPN